MPIPVINYAALPPQNNNVDQIGSFARGLDLGFMPMQKLQQLQAMRMANQMNQTRNEYLPRQLESDEERSRLANALAQVSLDFAPQMNQADLRSRLLGNALSQVDVGFAPQMKEADLRSKILHNQLASLGVENTPIVNDLTNQKLRGEIDYRKALTEQLPEKLQLEKDKQQRLRDRFNDAYKFATSFGKLTPTQKSVYVAENPEAMSNLMTQLGNKAFQEAISGVPLTEETQSNSMTFNPNPEQVERLVREGKATIPMNNQSPENPFQSNPDLVERIKRASEISATNNLNTIFNRKQMEGALQVKAFSESPEFKSKALLASQYAGALRRGKGAVEKFLGQNPESQLAYESFMHNDMVLLLNRIKQLEGMGSTDSQRRELNDMYNATLNSMTSNPERFNLQLDALLKSIDNVANSVDVSYNPLGYRSRLSDIKNEQNPNESLSFIDGVWK